MLLDLEKTLFFVLLGLVLFVLGCSTIDAKVISFKDGLGVIEVNRSYGASTVIEMTAQKNCLDRGYFTSVGHSIPMSSFKKFGSKEPIQPEDSNKFVFRCSHNSYTGTPQHSSTAFPTQAFTPKSTVTAEANRMSVAKTKCTEFGFNPNTEDFSRCMLQIELAMQKSMENERRYDDEKAAFDERMAEMERERERKKSLRQIELGLRLLGGQPPIEAINSLGTGLPIQPERPKPSHSTITLPGGRAVTCTTFDAFTDCN